MSAPVKKRALHIEDNANDSGSSSEDISDKEDVQQFAGQEVGLILSRLFFWSLPAMPAWLNTNPLLG